MVCYYRFMLVNIKNQPRELLVWTITLAHNAKDPQAIHTIRCHRCGTVLSQAQGRITSVLPGLTPSDRVPVIIKCHECGELFVFESRDSKRIIPKITLIHAKGTSSLFRCMICHFPLLEFNKDICCTLPEITRISLPHVITCYCKQQYEIVDIL